MICKIICVDGFLCMLHLDIVHMLFAYLHVICILSEHMRIICTLSAVVLDMFLSNRQSRCHPYIISSTLYISYHVQFNFRILSTQNAHCQCHLDVVQTCTHHRQTWLVDDIHHPHVIHMSSACRYIIYTLFTILYDLQLCFCTFSTQTHIVNAM